MGQSSSKNPVQSITREVKDLRSSIRRDRSLINDESKEQLQRILINYSHEVNTLSKKAKKSEIDSAQKLISSVTAELLSEPQLDGASVETSSFINMTRAAPSRSSKMSNKSASSSKSVASKKASPSSSPKTMKEIEEKLRELKPKIKVAIETHNKNELDQHDKNIKSLATNLEMIPLDNHITLLEKKEALEKTLSTWYRKVNKAKKQIARDNNIEYLADLQDKEKIEKNMLELARIEEGVYQAESHNQLEDFKTRLSHVQELSTEIDKKKKDLNALIDTRLNDHVEKFSEEKLRQAQEHHDKFKEQALSKFKKGRDSLDYANFKNYLQQLRDYVSKVPSSNEAIADKRQAALDDIDASMTDLDAKADALDQSNVLDTTEETKPSPEPKDEPVVLRKMASSQPALNRIETDRSIDGLYSYWVELNSKMPPQGCSAEELRSYQKIIEVITDSMVQKSKKIGNIIKALDSAGLSKSTATTTPRHVTSNDQTDLVRVKLTEIPISNVRQSQNIKQIEDIQNDVVDIGKNIHDTDKQKEMKTVLESHRKTLTRLTQYRNDNIRESAMTIIKTIEELLSILDSKVKNKTSGNLLNDIMSVGTKIQELGARIKKFNTKNDWNQIRQGLKQHETYLKHLDVSSGNIKKSRDDLLRQIQAYLNDLDASSIEASPEEKQIKRDVKNLKDKITRFSGAYKNVLYRKLENDTQAISNRIDHVVQDDAEAARLKAEITNNIKILEQKSIKDVQYGQENNGMKLAKIREDVEAVKLEMSQALTLTKQQYSVLDGRLTLCILALDNITIKDDDWCENERKRLYQEIQTYLSYITERIALSEEYNTVPLPDIAIKVNKQQLDVVSEEVAKVEANLVNVKLKIEAFVGFETSPEFFELDELLIQNTLKLDAFKLDRGHELYGKKFKLMKQIEECSELLEKRAQQTERIVYLENQVKEMVMRIDSFAGRRHDDEYDYLDEQLINLNVKVRKFEANAQLEARKMACVENIQYCLKKLNEATKDVYVNPQSTLV